MLKIFVVVVPVILLVFAAGFFYSERTAISDLYQQVVVKGKAFSLTRSSSEIHFTSGGLTLRGSLYTPGDGHGPFPGIVLVHGGTTLGRKLALYQIVGYQLARRGYVVLSFDFRGFGESEDPEKITSPQELDFIEDVKQAVSRLLSTQNVDMSKIFLVGHSFGAGVVIPAGIDDTRVKKIVSIAPGRRGYELIWAENAPLKYYPRQRLAQDMQNPQIHELPFEFLHPILQYITIDTILAYPDHPPILLIDGAKEDPKDLAFLADLYTRMSPPKAYTTIPEADHYFGTRRDDGGFYSIITYWESITEELVTVVDTWLRSGKLPQETPDS